MPLKLAMSLMCPLKVSSASPTWMGFFTTSCVALVKPAFVSALKSTVPSCSLVRL